MKFVWVNGRTPQPQSFCALCCEPIGQSYLRELATRLSYCDHRCYVGHRKVAARAPKTQARCVMTITDASSAYRNRNERV